MFTPFARRLVTSVLILLLVTATASAKPAGATSLFAMEDAYLRGVRITMKDGRTLVGYVAWSRDFFVYDAEPRFPKSLIDSKAWRGDEKRTLELYTKIYAVPNRVSRRIFPGEVLRLLIAVPSGTLTLPLKQIARIVALRMRYDGSDATDHLIDYIRSNTVRQLLISGKRFATFDDKDGSIFVSFNNRIDRRTLAALSAERNRANTQYTAELLQRWEQTRRRLERQKVVMIWYRTVD